MHRLWRLPSVLFLGWRFKSEVGRGVSWRGGEWAAAVGLPGNFTCQVHQFVDHDAGVLIVAEAQKAVAQLGVVRWMAHPVVDDLDEIVGIFDFERGISVVEELPGEFLLGHDAAECVEDDGAVEVERLGASRRAAPCDDDIAGLHEQVDALGKSFDVAGELWVLGAPLDQLVKGVVVFAADDDGLASVRVA